VVAGVERRLPAARLAARELNVAPGRTQKRVGVHDRVGKEEIAEAGGEELHAHHLTLRPRGLLGLVNNGLVPRLADKVCIVTGAGSGIGRASAELFAAEGAKVVAADLDGGAEGVTHQVDVADEHETEALAAAVLEEHGRIDVLFNNAGIAGVGDVGETSLELWEQVMRVNVRGVFLMSRAVVPSMIAHSSGSIVNMSSAIAHTGLGRRVSYAASKGAVLALTKSMQVDLAQHGVRVNALMPGTIMTPFVERYLRESYADPEEGRRSIRSRQLGGELGAAEDVAYAALYLASDESRFVMGSGLVVDGGLTAGKA
jgi:NAD(P)-dependent dehydrogenase (short-subunit alcohol dehydrogenase family)